VIAGPGIEASDGFQLLIEAFHLFLVVGT
jgi:hypothetical protein